MVRPRPIRSCAGLTRAVGAWYAYQPPRRIGRTSGAAAPVAGAAPCACGVCVAAPGVPYAPRAVHARVMRQLDHASVHRPYAAYFDAETRDIVGEYMAADVRAFGYHPPAVADQG